MIDNEQEVDRLIEALNAHMPMRTYATAPLVKVIRKEGPRLKVGDAIEIDSVLYLGDEAGIACAIELEKGKHVVVTSITHLRVDSDHPLAEQIHAYQMRRSERIANPRNRNSRKSQTSVAMKPKRKTARAGRGVLEVPLASADLDGMPPFLQDELRTLPLRRETWQVGLSRCEGQSLSDQGPMWLLVVANVDGQEIRTATVIDQPLTQAIAWMQLMPAFLSPMDGLPARPAKLVVCRREFHAAWKPLLSKIGVRCQFESDPQPVGQLLQAMGDVMAKQQLPPAEDVDIREYPQSDAVWQADFLRSPAWVMDEQTGPYRPSSVLVLDKAGPNVLMTCHTPEDPAPEMLMEFLVRTMARPGGESAERPRLVEVSNPDCYEYLRPRLEAAGVSCRLVDELSEFNDFCLKLARSFDTPGKCALSDGPGVTRAQLKSFYEAALYYFREAPWRRVPGEVPIEIRCNDPAMGTRYGIVMGRIGMQMGLCVYDDWEATQSMLCGYGDPDDSRALAVCYDDAEIMSAVDLQLFDRFGWPVATPEAWPAALRMDPRGTPRSPDAEELVFLDACLRAIPDFLKTNAISLTQHVQTGTRSVELHLAWKV